MSNKELLEVLIEVDNFETEQEQLLKSLAEPQLIIEEDDLKSDGDDNG
jgi:hypothetical protein